MNNSLENETDQVKQLRACNLYRVFCFVQEARVTVVVNVILSVFMKFLVSTELESLELNLK